MLLHFQDLDRSFRERGGRLWVFHGDSKEVLIRLIPLWGVTHVSFELDLEPIWQERDCKVINQLKSMNVRVIEGISYTLWDPREIIKANGGSPPLTFGGFLVSDFFCENVHEPTDRLTSNQRNDQRTDRQKLAS